MLLSAYLGTSGLGPILYQFFGITENPLTQLLSGVTDALNGWYSVNATFPTNAQSTSVRWQNSGTTTVASEYFDPRFPTLVTGSAGAVPVTNSAGNTPADVQTIKTQTVTALGPVTYPGVISSYDGRDTSGTGIILSRFPSSGLSTLDAPTVWNYVSRSITDKAGFSLTQVFPSNFSGLGIGVTGHIQVVDTSISNTSVTNPVTVGTNNDKTGYSLIQVFPANFSGLGIATTGHIQNVDTVANLLTNSDKSGYSLTQVFPANFSGLGIGSTGHIQVVDTVVNPVTIGTNLDKTGYSLTQIFPTNFSGLGIATTGHIQNVDTISNYVGNTPQTGDVFSSLATKVPTNLSFTGSNVNANTQATAASLTFTQVGNVVGSVTGSIGNISGVTFPSNFSGLGIGTTGHIQVVDLVVTSQTSGLGPVIVGTNLDKTGYSLTQTFPSNFSALGIGSSGHIQVVDLVSNIANSSGIGPVIVGASLDKTGYSLTQSFPANFASLGIGSTGHILNVDTLSNISGINLDSKGRVLLQPWQCGASGVNVNVIAVENQNLTSKAGVNLNYFFDNIGNTTTKVVDDVGTGGGGSLTGPNSISLTFVDTLNNRVPLVEFTILGQGIGRSDTSGVSTFGLNSGNYTIVSRATNGVLFSNTQFSVNGTTSQIVTGTSSQVPGPPSDPTFCTVFCYFKKGNGEAAIGVVVKFTLPQVAVSSGSQVVLVDRNITAKSDANGLMQVNIPRNDNMTPGNLQWTISIPQANFSMLQTIASSTFNIGTLIV